MIRCSACGNGFLYREGMRFCPACAASVVADCASCAGAVLVGDRHCPFCAAPTGAAPSQAPRAAAASAPAATFDDAEFRALAMNLATAAMAGARQEPDVLAGKPNLDQGDVDSLFG